jgi:bifunctional non-homologous end joining protein LigD
LSEPSKRPAHTLPHEEAGATPAAAIENGAFRGGRQFEEVVKEQAMSNAKTAGPSQAVRSSAARGKLESRADSVAGVALSNPERILFPEQGVSKRELARYYEAIADWILPHIIDRALTLVRCPQGRAKKCFYQKHWSAALPEAVESVVIREKQGPEPYVVIRDLQGLISLVQVSVLELHPWGARIDQLERPDVMVFDLDPGEGVEWKNVKQAAVDVREVLAEAELTSFVRTSGGKGLHVVVPITRRSSWEDVGDFAQDIAVGLARRSPERYVSRMRKSLRQGRIFVDYLRNRRGATSIASYSTRAHPGAPVATPLAWDELPDLTASNQWTLQNVPQRLESLNSPPWDTFASLRQSLTREARSFAARLARVGHQTTHI